MPKKIRQFELLLRSGLFVCILGCCGGAWAAPASCLYPESGSGIGGTGISASGIGGTGKTERGSGIGGTGGKEHKIEVMQSAGNVTAGWGAAIANSHGRSRNLAAGDTVCVGETITTPQSASVEIRMLDDSLLSVRPQTELRIEKYAFNGTDDDGSLLAITRGTVRVVTGRIGKEHPGNTLIRTPSVLIGVRGTDHEVAVIPPRDKSAYPSGTYDKVNHGVTFMRSEKGEIDVHPGQVGFAESAADSPAILTSVPAFYLSSPLESTSPGPGESAFDSRRRDDVEQHRREGGNDLPGLPDIPDLPDVLEIPELPEIPDIDLPELPEVPDEQESSAS